jgi:hypothetical protein
MFFKNKLSTQVKKFIFEMLVGILHCARHSLNTIEKPCGRRWSLIRFARDGNLI